MTIDETYQILLIQEYQCLIQAMIFERNIFIFR